MELKNGRKKKGCRLGGGRSSSAGGCLPRRGYISHKPHISGVYLGKRAGVFFVFCFFLRSVEGGCGLLEGLDPEISDS